MMRRLLVLALLTAAPLAAQQTVDPVQSRQRLEELRRERDRLEAAQRRTEGRITDSRAEMRNLEQRQQATNRVVNLIEEQISGLGSQMERSAAELALAQDNLTERKAVLNRRLADIYKRGPLHTHQVLLTAESFGNLLARYKYLYLTSRQDKALVQEVQSLTSRVQSQREEILRIKSELDRTRADREAEMEHFADLAAEQSARLAQLNRTHQANATAIDKLKRDEATLNSLLASLDRDRRAAETRPGSAPSTRRLTTADVGNLDWPVSGDIILQFGQEALPGGGVVINNGIGIAAPVGTPIKVIAAGRVARVATLGTYGLSVIVEHGDTYSLYMQLQRASVVAGQDLAKGDVVGTVGGANSGRGPHLYFEIRGGNQIALDPMTWLRNRGSR